MNRVDITAAASGERPYAADAGRRVSSRSAQFQEMSDAEKLSRPSYQQLKGGVIIGAAAAAVEQDDAAADRLRGDHHRQGTGAAAPAALLRDRRPVPALPGRHRRGALVALVPDQEPARSRFADKIAVGPEGYTVASTRDNRPFDASVDVLERGDGASRSWNARLAADPALAGSLHVLPEPRGERAHEPADPDLFVPAVAPHAAWPTTSRRPTATRASRCAPRCPLDLTLTGTRLDGSTATQIVHRDVSLFGPGRRHRDRVARASSRSSRATGSRTSSPTTCRTSSSTTRISRGATRRRPPTRASIACGRGSRSWCSRRTEFTDGKDMQGKPLPVLRAGRRARRGRACSRRRPSSGRGRTCTSTPISRTDGDASMPGVLQQFEQTIAENPDRAYSRILCPRHLEPDIGYHALPDADFRERPPGRARPGRPGHDGGHGVRLGQPPDAVSLLLSAGSSRRATSATSSTWSSCSKPRPVDKRVGVRDMDVLHPGSNLPKIDLPAELGGVLKLGGALRVPFDDAASGRSGGGHRSTTSGTMPFPHPFETAMARRVNLADDYARDAAVGRRIPTAIPTRCHVAALRALACAREPAARGARRHARSRTTRTGSTG